MVKTWTKWKSREKCEHCGGNSLHMMKTGYPACRDCRSRYLKEWRHAKKVSLSYRTEKKPTGIEAASPSEYRSYYLSLVRFGGIETVDVVLERDGYKCLVCGLSNEEHLERWNTRLTIDHIDGKGRYSKQQNNDINNLQTLCFSCHGKKDSKRRGRKNYER